MIRKVLFLISIIVFVLVFLKTDFVDLTLGEQMTDQIYAINEPEYTKIHNIKFDFIDLAELGSLSLSGYSMLEVGTKIPVAVLPSGRIHTDTFGIVFLVLAVLPSLLSLILLFRKSKQV